MNKYTVIDATGTGKSYPAPREYQIAMQLLDKWLVKVIDAPHNTKIMVVCSSHNDILDILKQYPELSLVDVHVGADGKSGVFTVKR